MRKTSGSGAEPQKPSASGKLAYSGTRKVSLSLSQHNAIFRYSIYAIDDEGNVQKTLFQTQPLTLLSGPVAFEVDVTEVLRMMIVTETRATKRGQRTAFGIVNAGLFR